MKQHPLDRTLRLMRDYLSPTVSDRHLLTALRRTEVILCGDASNLRSHSAQTAFVTAALLAARSGLRVWLLAPDIELVGPQPPLTGSRLISALEEVGRDLLPGYHFKIGFPGHLVDLAVTVGDSRCPVPARKAIAMTGSAWSGAIVLPAASVPWDLVEWPIGGLVAAAFVGAEAFKAAMRKLRAAAVNQEWFDRYFAPSDQRFLALAREGTPCASDLGLFDMISGGAIAQASLYAIARLPSIMARCRLIEPEINDLTNLNRYMLLRRSRLHLEKAKDLASQNLGGLEIESLVRRFDESTVASIGALSPAVLVGVDDIPTRWAVQEERPTWLGIGATSHYSVMASYHSHGLGCAACLHADDAAAPELIPTVAYVSFWSGLLLAALFLRHVVHNDPDVAAQQAYFTPLGEQSEPFYSPVAPRSDCRLNCASW